jgi:cysteine desulfurase
MGLVKGIYLDWAATGLPDADILGEQARAAISDFANPSSLHAPGKQARSLLEEARARIARAIGAKGESIVFTSGGTEANQLVLSSLLCRLRARPPGFPGGVDLVSTRLDHPSIHECASGLEKSGLRRGFLATDGAGRIDPDSLAQAMAGKPSMACLSLVNNETGCVEDLGAVVSAIRSRQGGKRCHIHVDAVQAFGKIPFRPAELGVDSASFSAHKLGGPRGSGFLWTARPLEAFLRGGGQEGGQRSGTENTAGAWAGALALEKALGGLEGKIAKARLISERLMAGLRALGGIVLPEARSIAPEAFSPWILLSAFPGVPGEVLARSLSDSLCYVSTGSACSSKTRERRVLDALGVNKDLSQCAFRASWGWSTAEAEIDSFLKTLDTILQTLKVARHG